MNDTPTDHTDAWLSLLHMALSRVEVLTEEAFRLRAENEEFRDANTRLANEVLRLTGELEPLKDEVNTLSVSEMYLREQLERSQKDYERSRKETRRALDRALRYLRDSKQNLAAANKYEDEVEQLRKRVKELHDTNGRMFTERAALREEVARLKAAAANSGEVERLNPSDETDDVRVVTVTDNGTPCTVSLEVGRAAVDGLLIHGVTVDEDEDLSVYRMHQFSHPVSYRFRIGEFVMVGGQRCRIESIIVSGDGDVSFDVRGVVGELRRVAYSEVEHP